MQKLDLGNDHSSKPAGSILGVKLSLDTVPSVTYKLLSAMPRLSQIRKDNYQSWQYLEDYPDDWMYGDFLAPMRTTDLSMNPCKYTGFPCGTAPVVGNSEYFWQDEVQRYNTSMMKSCGELCYPDDTVGAIATDIRMPVDFFIVSFSKIVKKHTLGLNGESIVTVSMGKRKWSESTLPTLLLMFEGGACTSIEVCDAYDEVGHIDFEIYTQIPVSYNRVKSSIK